MINQLFTKNVLYYNPDMCIQEACSWGNIPTIKKILLESKLKSNYEDIKPYIEASYIALCSGSNIFKYEQDETNRLKIAKMLIDVKPPSDVTRCIELCEPDNYKLQLFFGAIQCIEQQESTKHKLL